jgi:glutamate-ammonia-ligase adenylyltransferase
MPLNDLTAPKAKRFRLPAARWPAPADTAAASRLLERFAAIDPACARLATRKPVIAMLQAIGGNSPFLSDLAIRDAASVRKLVSAGPDAAVAAAMGRLRQLPPRTERRALSAALRQTKRIVALATAIADIGGIWDLARVTEALSSLAQTALQKATAHILLTAHDQGLLALPEPATPELGSGFTVLGMGKLGAGELNYSSDIDLVLLYDPAAGVFRGDPDEIGAIHARFARDLVTLMEARTAEGYVFRTDLRLRPDPAATPPAVALLTALAYYESMGQNWERAAMLKARPVAGDLALGAEFLHAIRPFIWRRGLDFAALADLHAMKRRIDAHRQTALGEGRTAAECVSGHNVKLGEGGIREIEFAAQTLLLVWGGRYPDLRQPTTLGALSALTRAAHMDEGARARLEAAYEFLRRVEHRLQMVADHQTQTLPEAGPELERFAIFMGFADAESFASVLLGHLETVRREFVTVFEHIPGAPEAPGIELDFRGDGEPAATVSALKAMGFADPLHIVASVRAWQAGRLRAMRSERSRDLLQPMLPDLLQALARQPAPDTAFKRFDNFLASLPAGVQILSLFQRNPTLLGRVATVLGAAAPLAEHLANTPESLEGLLLPLEQSNPASHLQTRLADARDMDDTLAIVRRVVREEDFSLSVATVEGRLAPVEAAIRRTAMLDAALNALVPRVIEDFIRRNGRIKGGEIGLVLLGKAGAGRPMAESDLDLMLIYDHPETVSESTGARSVPASQWFVRAAHAIVACLTTPGRDGPLYDVDMRLRPSGNKGPVAVSLSAFRRYHAESAWTWERMALTRARVVVASAGLRRRIEAAVAEAVAGAGDAAKIRADAAQMRARMAREYPGKPPWDMKYRPGGMIDAEFIEQVRILTRRAPNDEDAWLASAWEFMLAVQTLLRILVGKKVPETLPQSVADALLRGLGITPASIEALVARLDSMAARVRRDFTELVGDVTA